MKFSNFSSLALIFIILGAAIAQNSNSGRGNGNNIDDDNSNENNNNGNNGNGECQRACRNGRCINRVCVCNAGYSGLDCSRPNCTLDCGSNGACVAPNTCQCRNGYSGAQCRIPPSGSGGNNGCPQGCGNGRCVNNVCVCFNGYGGANCSTPICSPDCGSNGACVAPNTCQCRNGYSGAQCRIAPGSGNSGCPRGCVNGRCVNNICQCSSGYEGDNCATPRCILGCGGANGVCIAPETCQCRNGYSGGRCTIPPFSGGSGCPQGCDNGRCVNNVCQCFNGYGGSSCSEPLCSGGCGPNGRCTAPNVCTCINGYSGNGCVIPPNNGGGGFNSGRARCDRGCGNGRCVADNVCECSTGYGGSSCNTPVCDGGCNGQNGVCEAPNRCRCFGGWTGPNCLGIPGSGGSGSGTGSGTACKPQCEYGDCVNGVCRCFSGFTGTACDVAVAGPAPAPSSNYYDDGRSGTAGKQIGDSCVSNEECSRSIGNSYCETLSDSCRNGGECKCRNGYKRINGQCLKPVKLGDDCSSPDTVCIENSRCSMFGTCECTAPYKPGPLNLCASPNANSVLGDECTSNDQCYFDLICSRGECACAPGRMSDSDYTCRALDYGDRCTGNRDCQHLARSECSSTNQTCVCQSGYSLQSYTTETGDIARTCTNANIRRKDDSCPADLQSICSAGYACITCPNRVGDSRCYWPIAKGPTPTTRAPVYDTSATLQFSRFILTIGVVPAFLLTHRY